MVIGVILVLVIVLGQRIPKTKEDSIINEVKRFHAQNCTRGRKSNDPYIKCDDVLKYIKKFNKI